MTSLNHHFEGQTAGGLLPRLMQGVLDKGEEVGSRNGRAAELINTQVVIHNPVFREILTPGRKADVFAQIAETCWVLSGRDDIRWLAEYLPRAPDFSDDGFTWSGAYGPRIRDMRGVDQLAYVVDTLRADPMSRQAVVQIYDAMRDTMPDLKDRPCNTQLQFFSRLGQLHLTVTVRSNDLMWGWSGINAFEWSTMQEIVARMLGIDVGTLTFNIGSLHLYGQHWEKARRISRESVPASNPAESVYQPFDPHHTIKSVRDLNNLLEQWFDWEQQCRTGNFTGPLHIKEPLFRSWAHAIAYYWSGDERWLQDIGNTRLALAIAASPLTGARATRAASLNPVAPPTPTGPSSDAVAAFGAYVKKLHAIKDASYGDSWKKRGEQLSILANIARKVDRMGQDDEFESSADTVLDLWVYLNKYILWLKDLPQGPEQVDPALDAQLNTVPLSTSQAMRETHIREQFEEYLDEMDDMSPMGKISQLRSLATKVAPLARDLWIEELGEQGEPCDD